MPPPAQPNQLPGQQLQTRENSQFKKLVVRLKHFSVRFFIRLNSVSTNKNSIEKVWQLPEIY